jgi:response regulator RpfG family c-di-GMP phosphodiesterase
MSEWLAGRRLAAGGTRTRMLQVSMPPTIETESWDIPVVSVSSTSGDHEELERLLPMPRWRVYRSSRVRSAVKLLRALRLVPILICDANLFPETWQEMLAQIGLLPEPPHLIVASRIADNHLWAEALNLGAYDVLGKPFDVTELTRSLSLAWLRTQREQRSAGARVTEAVA